MVSILIAYIKRYKERSKNMKTKRAKDREIYDNYYVFEAWESRSEEHTSELQSLR